MAKEPGRRERSREYLEAMLLLDSIEKGTRSIKEGLQKVVYILEVYYYESIMQGDYHMASKLRGSLFA